MAGKSYWPWILGGAAIAGGAVLLARALPGAIFGAISGGSGPNRRLPGTLFTIVLENHSYRDVVGSSSMPYLNSLISQYALATNYNSPYHPSLPNYIVMASGQTFGISDDTGHVIAGTDNLPAQFDASRVAWRGYGESMPHAGYLGTTNDYAERHMPFGYFSYVRQDPTYLASRIVPMTPYFAQDLASGAVKYMWLTPNICNDAHDCTLATSDNWLRTVIPQIQASPGYQRGGAIIVTFDEGEGGSDQIATVMISPLIRGPVRDATPYDHRSYCATVQDLLGMPRLPATAGVQSMWRMLNA